MKKYDALSVPPVKWINDPKRNPKRYVAASLFAGGGFASLGLKLAGFDVRYACEFIEKAREVYKANAPAHVVLDGRDVREVSGADILKACRVKRGELDLLDGSPPCRLFSRASMGKAKKRGDSATVKYDNKEQRLDDLFDHFARLLHEVKPKVFIAENVAAMADKTNAPHYLKAHKDLEAAGYSVKSAIIDASRLGVPQMRKRLIFVGVRNDLVKQYGVRPVFPKARPVGETLGVSDIVPDAMHICGTTSPTGEMQWRDSRLPSPTFTAFGYKRLLFPTEIKPQGFVKLKSGKVRQVTQAELKGLFGVPQDFKLSEKMQEAWKRLGDAHAPLACAAVADALALKVLDKLR